MIEKMLNTPVSIIIPAYNEEKIIKSVLERIITILKANVLNYEIIVVNDGSSDSTRSEATLPGVMIKNHNKNIGYGAALKTGIKFANFESIMIIDADGTYPVDDIPKLIKKFHGQDMVIGSRDSFADAIPIFRKPAKWILKILAQYITKSKISDLNSGFRIFKKKLALDYFHLLPEKFSFTTTITVAMLNDNRKVQFLPVSYKKRVGSSKIVPWDFFSFFMLILKLSTYFNPLRIFLPLSLFFFLLGIIKTSLDIYFIILNQTITFNLLFNQPIISITSLLFFISSLQIFLIGIVADAIINRYRGPN